MALRKKHPQPTSLEELEAFALTLQEALRKAEQQLEIAAKRRAQLLGDMEALCQERKNQQASPQPAAPPPTHDRQRSRLTEFMEREAKAWEDYGSPEERQRHMEIKQALRRVIPAAERVSLIEEDKVLQQEIWTRRSVDSSLTAGSKKAAKEIRQKFERWHSVMQAVREAMNHVRWTTVLMEVDDEIRTVQLHFPEAKRRSITDNLDKFKTKMKGKISVKVRRPIRFSFSAMERYKAKKLAHEWVCVSLEGDYTLKI